MLRIAPSVPVARPLRLGFLIDLAPRKLGSFEDLTLAICREARRRGHDADFFCHEPVHPTFARELAARGGRLGLLEALLRDRRAAVRRLRELDVIQLHHCGARAPMALIAYAALPARVLYVDRGSGDPSRDRRSRLHGLVAALLDRITALRLSGVRAVSGWVEARDARRFGAARCGTIHNGVDLVRFQPGRRRGGPPRIIAVAQLIPQKGLHVLLRALARLQSVDARLLVVGDGPMRGELEALAEKLGVAARVNFAGLCSDVPRRLREADVLVHPAVWDEAFGYAIAEALASGVPVVASAVGGIPEVVADGETGFLVPPGEPAAIAGALDRLLADPELRRQMGAAARRRAEKLFDVEMCAARYVDWAEGAASTRS